MPYGEHQFLGSMRGIGDLCRSSAIKSVHLRQYWNLIELPDRIWKRLCDE